jgi:predicted DNA-binding helix-hairpin-helix protein
VDWLLWFHGFEAAELVSETSAYLCLDIDPKLAWALAHRMDVNRSEREMLLRVPGTGVRSVERILVARRHRQWRLADLAQIWLSLAKISPFVGTADHSAKGLDTAGLAAPKPRQLDLLS